MTLMTNHTISLDNILVLGATGKTGRRIAEKLRSIGKNVRAGSRSAQPAFDWNHENGWDKCLEGMDAVYINYAPDLAIPGASDSIQSFVNKAKDHGIRKLVLLSGRGEEEAQECERIVQESGVDWTIVRASWFNQNFSEGAFVEMVLSGQITTPVGDVGEPFVDVDDIADVVVAALTESGHSARLYEVTGPRLMTFKDIAKELSKACGREVKFLEVPHDAFIEGVKKSGAPQDVVWMIDYLFNTVLDGRNACLADGIQQALGRPPKDFRDFTLEEAAKGTWNLKAEIELSHG